MDKMSPIATPRRPLGTSGSALDFYRELSPADQGRVLQGDLAPMGAFAHAVRHHLIRPERVPQPVRIRIEQKVHRVRRPWVGNRYRLHRVTVDQRHVGYRAEVFHIHNGPSCFIPFSRTGNLVGPQPPCLG